ncbi:MAG: dihydroneopterin aldolase [Chloroflexi bacterium]|nr:dihydroneopterin aldolase [Chloroflexota bacterium]
MIESSSAHGADRLVIRGLELRCVVGVEDWERRMAQRLVVDVEVRGDFSTAADSDDFREALDYRAPCVQAAEIAAQGEYRLVETLADRIAGAVLRLSDRVEEVSVSVFKPLALAGFGKAEVRVEVVRGR